MAGGPLFTIEHASFPKVDHFVLNEAEITLPRFLADLEQGAPKRIYTTDEFPEIRQTPVPLWALFHKPRLFPQAIELAIYGYHFRRVCEL